DTRIRVPLQRRKRLRDFYGAQVVFHGLKSGSVFLRSVPAPFWIFAQQLHGYKTSSKNAGIMTRPQLAGGAVAVTIDNDARKVGGLARIVSVFDDVLQPQSVRLIFKFSLVAVDRRRDANLRHENAGVSDESASGEPCDGQPDARSARFL